MNKIVFFEESSRTGSFFFKIKIGKRIGRIKKLHLKISYFLLGHKEGLQSPTRGVIKDNHSWEIFVYTGVKTCIALFASLSKQTVLNLSLINNSEIPKREINNSETSNCRNKRLYCMRELGSTASCGHFKHLSILLIPAFIYAPLKTTCQFDPAFYFRHYHVHLPVSLQVCSFCD